ncbi:MAG: hypothetical protein KDI64_04835, partial [Candidatus Accumulibacter sp.]|nr:hypothetical protein [Accumulibacter sp.]
MASSIHTTTLLASASMASGRTLADSPRSASPAKIAAAARPRRALSASAAPSSCHGTSTIAVASTTSPSSTVR